MFGAEEAEACAESLLARELPRRWAHVRTVASRAAKVRELLGDDVLTVAAWLHDVGYSSVVASSGFHPLDGARYLRTLGAPMRVAGLVDFHSSAAVEANAFGVGDELAEFEDEQTLTRDLLWYVDMTTGPDGSLVAFKDRMAEVRNRYPSDHYVVRALDLGMPERVAAVERAEAWLSSAGLTGHV